MHLYLLNSLIYSDCIETMSRYCVVYCLIMSLFVDNESKCEYL